jgi:Glycosyltransferase family 87
VLAESGHLWACGIVIGLAMMKHTIAGPFLLCFLVRGQWKPIVSCLAYLVLARIVVWYFTATDPVEMSIQMVRSAQTWAGKGSGPRISSADDLLQPANSQAEEREEEAHQHDFASQRQCECRRDN